MVLTSEGMYSTMRCCLVIALLVLFQNCLHCLEEGEECNDETKGRNGVCKLIEDCPGIRKEINAGSRPKNCGFKGKTPIVCCPKSSDPSLTRVGEKSIRACKSYEQYGYKRVVASVVVGDDSDYENVEDCPWEVQALTVIVDGTKAIKGEFPHMALIGYGTRPNNYLWKCGGSLISEKFVLTAAHCIYTRDGTPQFVRLGNLNYTNPGDDGGNVQEINVKQHYIHPDYKSPFHYNDVALLQLEKPVKLNRYVKPACLYTKETVDGRAGIITGWGVTEHGRASDHLLKAIVGSFTAERCNKTYSRETRTLPRGIDGNLQLCYGSDTNDKDSCPGDSGGPIQIYSKEFYCSYSVFGITSFGIKCGHKTIPGGYVRLWPYIEWIESIVWP